MCLIDVGTSILNNNSIRLVSHLGQIGHDLVELGIQLMVVVFLLLHEGIQGTTNSIDFCCSCKLHLTRRTIRGQYRVATCGFGFSKLSPKSIHRLNLPPPRPWIWLWNFTQGCALQPLQKSDLLQHHRRSDLGQLTEFYTRTKPSNPCWTESTANLGEE